MDKIIWDTLDKLSRQFAAQANFPMEEGDTWSYSKISFLKGRISILHELSYIPFSDEVLSRNLYNYHQLVVEHCDTEELKWLRSLNII